MALHQEELLFKTIPLDTENLREVRIYDKNMKLKRVVMTGPPKDDYTNPYIEHREGKRKLKKE